MLLNDAVNRDLRRLAPFQRQLTDAARAAARRPAGAPEPTAPPQGSRASRQVS